MSEAETIRATERETILTTLWCHSCVRGWDYPEGYGHIIHNSTWDKAFFLCRECLGNDAAHRHTQPPNVTVIGCIGHLAARL